MATSRAATPEQYLADLPPDRREAIGGMRALILKNLPKGYREAMGYGMITYSIPLERYPDTYNGQPLCYAALAAQKGYCSVYLMNCYVDSKEAADLTAAFKKAGKKLDMGKSCVRFRSLDDLPLDAIARVIATTTPDSFIERYEAGRKRTAARRSKAAAVRKPSAKATPAPVSARRRASRRRA